MGYSTSERTLERIIDQLRRLQGGQMVKWQTEPGNAGKFAYKLREGLYIATLFKHKYPALAEAARRYRIRVTAHNIVLAIRIGADEAKLETEDGSPLEGPRSVPGPSPAQPGVPADSGFLDAILVSTAPRKEAALQDDGQVAESVSAVGAIAGPQTEFSIIERVRKLRGDGVTTPVHFPQAGLTDRQLERVYRWAKLQTPEQMLLWSFPSLTVAPEDPTVAEYQWRPAGED